MENASISVVIPVYNLEKYVDKCIHSVVNQSYKNLEIIIVDDGSTDGSASKCDAWEKKDSRVKVIHKANGGVSDARNKGIETATGSLLVFVDGDDYIDTDLVEYLYDLMCSNDADISVCQHRKVDDYGNVIAELAYEDVSISGNEACMQAYYTNPSVNSVAWGKLYKMSLFENLRFPVGKYHEDVFMTYKAIAQCERIYVGGKVKYNYFTRKGSITNSDFHTKHLDAIYGYLEQRDFIETNYPQLLRHSNSRILYASNQVLLRMIRSGYSPDNELRNEMQNYYRKYEWDFLCGPSSVKAKMFSVFAFLDLKTLLCISRFLWRASHEYKESRSDFSSRQNK